MIGEISQNDLERIKDDLKLGKITLDQANIAIVLMQRVYLVKSTIPREIRKAYSQAVKDGVLKHIKKDGSKPEVYYNPSFEYLVNGERNAEVQKGLIALSKVCI